MKTLVIGPKSYSSWSMRPWHYFKTHGISFEEMNIPFAQKPDAFELSDETKAAIRKVSPTGKIPCLIEDGRALGESAAIMAAQWQDTNIAEPKVIGALAVAMELSSGFGAVRTKLSFCAVDEVDEQVSFDQLAQDLKAEIHRLSTIATSLPELDYKGIIRSMLVPYLMRLNTYKITGLSPQATKTHAAILDDEAVAEWQAFANKEPRTLPILHDYIRGFCQKLGR